MLPSDKKFLKLGEVENIQVLVMLLNFEGCSSKNCTGFVVFMTASLPENLFIALVPREVWISFWCL